LSHKHNRLRYRSLTLTQAITAMAAWFYWSDTERNVKGEDLATCLHLSGTGGERDDDRDLDETRSTRYSWLLTVTHAGTLADPNTFKVLGCHLRVVVKQ
jgi:hypothetical protein